MRNPEAFPTKDMAAAAQDDIARPGNGTAGVLQEAFRASCCGKVSACGQAAGA